MCHYPYLRIFETYPYLEKYGLLFVDILWKVLSISGFLLDFFELGKITNFKYSLKVFKKV